MGNAMMDARSDVTSMRRRTPIRGGPDVRRGTPKVREQPASPPLLFSLCALSDKAPLRTVVISSLLASVESRLAAEGFASCNLLQQREPVDKAPKSSVLVDKGNKGRTPPHDALRNRDSRRVWRFLHQVVVEVT